MSKTDDQLILRLISQDSPGSASTSEAPSEKMSKAVAPRDTKQLFGRSEAPCMATYARTPDDAYNIPMVQDV